MKIPMIRGTMHRASKAAAEEKTSPPRRSSLMMTAGEHGLLLGEPTPLDQITIDKELMAQEVDTLSHDVQTIANGHFCPG